MVVLRQRRSGVSTILVTVLVLLIAIVLFFIIGYLLIQTLL
jgi:hypothetical protein